MASAKQDFERFVRWLYQPGKEVPADVRRLANLSLANFVALAETSKQRNQRASYLAGLMQSGLADTVDAAPAAAADVANGAWPWVRLSSFTLGPFRGFRNPAPFDLKKQIILFYGPNGSGKTSICEGLEYALLGEVEEASSKRIAPRVYLANIHARRFNDPELKALDHQGREVAVTANLDAYRFCFIEKNRIDAFSRIAARPAAQRTELIATLFGMDQFNEFVSHFNESIDSQLVLTRDKQNDLARRRAALTTDHETVKGEAAELEKLVAEETALAQTYAADGTYEGLKQLMGTAEVPGRLQELDTLLDAVLPGIIGVTRTGLLEAFDAVHQEQRELNDIVAALRARSDQVSFKDLYTSVLALQKTYGDRCPACDTPLAGSAHVSVDPYGKATTGLKQLEELGTLQEKQRATQGKLQKASRDLRQILGSLAVFTTARQEQETPVGQYLLNLPDEPAGTWWDGIYPQPAVPFPGLPTLDQLLALAERIEAQDAETRGEHQAREPRIAERNRLREFQLKLQAQDQKRQQLRERVAAADARIKAFETANAELIKQADAEKLSIERDTPFKAAYDRFLEELRTYRNQLPGQLMAGLNELALTLYNGFNRNDLDADKLASLYLPLTGEDKIEISFRGNPERKVDALHVLSEGHIRCLGLAVLLAKAKSISCPVIVFDDAINAIDHDHRGGIRETIFESDHFEQAQLIVTCHSNEFIKDIQQHLTPQRRNDCQVYLLRHHDGDYQPRVSGNIPSANYVAKARAARDALNDRDALAASRQALEMLSEKVWRWLGSHSQDLGTLNLMLVGVNAEPSLRNLCEALYKKLNDAKAFAHQNKDILLASYGRILGIPANNLVWTYLNKGTHEEADRDDFDGETVESVVKALEDLDQLNLRNGK